MQLFDASHAQAFVDAVNLEIPGTEEARFNGHLLILSGPDAEQILFFKGLSWAAEHYGIYKTEVQVPGDPHAQPNLTGLQLHEHFDTIIVTGQAMYNCVRRTVEQQHEFIVAHDPAQASKMVVLTDTMSAIPGTEPGGERSFAAMQAQGLRLSTTLEFADELRQMMPV